MFIAANALHIDTCWINQLEDLLSDSNYKSLRKLLGISEDYRVIGSVILGYRKDKDIAIKARKEDFIRYL